uniref:Aminoacylase n=1 Tax=Herpetomonas muscarum TaxID=5718 RepID=U5KM30_HERMU|nr:aminoacylase [Herpetomonas muscarum]
MSELNLAELDRKVADVFAQVVAWRRHIHAHPELSFEETETAAYVEAELKKLDPEAKHLTVHRPIPNGVFADLKGTRGTSDKIILLRADMDALPIQELANVDFKSKKDGVSHMCGHDCHSAMLLGAVKLLLAEVDKIDGTVRFLFQPAEEVPPGGAELMIKAGCLEGVTMAFAEHILPVPNGPVGSILMRDGVMYNSSDNFAIRIIGKGGHASMPELAIDPVAIASQCVVALQSMVTRRLPSNGAPVLTICGFSSAVNAFTIISDEVVMKGSLRCDNKETRIKAKKYMEEVLASCTSCMGASYELTWQPSYEMCFNDSDAFRIGERVAKRILPNEKDIVYLPFALKPAEDFSLIAERVPSNYVCIGSYNEALGCTKANHNANFLVDEECFKVGVKFHYGVIHDLLM